jgi:hypothetical protein
MTNRPGSGESLQGVRRKDLRYQAHSFVHGEGTLRPFRRNNARTLLPAVLQSEEPVVGDARSLRMAEDGEDAALVGGFKFLSQELGRWKTAGKWRVHAIFQGLSTPSFAFGPGRMAPPRSMWSPSISPTVRRQVEARRTKGELVAKYSSPFTVRHGSRENARKPRFSRLRADVETASQAGGCRKNRETLALSTTPSCLEERTHEVTSS